MDGSGGTVTMTGGVVFAEGKEGHDIGPGDGVPGGSLNISGTAALFLYNDRSIPPVTTTHTRQTFYDHGGGISEGDRSNFSFPVPLCIL